MSSDKYQVEIADIHYWRKQIKCQVGCPVDTDSRGYVLAIAEGNYEVRLLRLASRLPLALLVRPIHPEFGLQLGVTIGYSYQTHSPTCSVHIRF